MANIPTLAVLSALSLSTQYDIRTTLNADIYIVVLGEALFTVEIPAVDAEGKPTDRCRFIARFPEVIQYLYQYECDVVGGVDDWAQMLDPYTSDQYSAPSLADIENMIDHLSLEQLTADIRRCNSISVIPLNSISKLM